MNYENIQNYKNVVDFVLGKLNNYNLTLTVDAPAQIVTRLLLKKRAFEHCIGADRKPYSLHLHMQMFLKKKKKKLLTL